LGYLKDGVYKNNPHTVHEIKEEIKAAVIGITPDTLGTVVASCHHQLRIMLDASGSHIEHVFH
jgi:hypothetical protein